MALVGIMSDAHGNTGAFDRCVQVLQERGARSFVFLGDAVGYIPSAEVVRRLQDMGGRVRCIRGNHEALLLNGDLEAERDRVYQLAALRPLLTDEEIGFLASWPPFLHAKMGRFNVAFVHGSPSDPTYGYVYPDTDLGPFGTPADFLFMGNSHHPFVRRSNDCCFVNVGSCGLPRDHGSLGAAATFDDDSGAVEVYRFDIEAANGRAMRGPPALHPSVVAVMSRRKDEIYGTRV
ncbi:MAG: metallophosphoesterase family protein [Rubrivivax sp.]|nr:metallophosphoesterase family protein [Rubrivivax sp.]